MRKGLGICAASWAKESAKRQSQSCPSLRSSKLERETRTARARLGKAERPRLELMEIGPCIHMPPVLLKLTQSDRPFHRFTPYQILSQYPTLLVDSVSDSSFTSNDLAHILRGGLNDPSVDVKVEAMKAIKGAIQGGWSVIKENEIKSSLILDALMVRLS